MEADANLKQKIKVFEVRLRERKRHTKGNIQKSKWRLGCSTLKRGLVYFKSFNYAHEGSSLREKAQRCSGG